MKEITAKNIKTSATKNIIVVSAGIRTPDSVMTVIHAEDLYEDKLDMVHVGAMAKKGCIYFKDLNNDVWEVCLAQI